MKPEHVFTTLSDMMTAVGKETRIHRDAIVVRQRQTQGKGNKGLTQDLLPQRTQNFYEAYGRNDAYAQVAETRNADRSKELTMEWEVVQVALASILRSDTVGAA